jgi:hypothetical protein
MYVSIYRVFQGTQGDQLWGKWKRVSSVSTVTRLWDGWPRDCEWIFSRQNRFMYFAEGPEQLCDHTATPSPGAVVNGYREQCTKRKSGQDVKLTIHKILVPILKISGAIPLFPHAFVGLTGKIFMQK